MTRRGGRRAGARWAREQARDPYVRQARQAGFRSRAVYKLQALDRRFRLLRPGLCVLDVGAAPGGWCQYACRQVGPGGRIVAVDRLAMAPLPAVVFIQGDITEGAVQSRVLRAMNGPAGLVISDLAPDITGITATDQARAEALAYAVLSLCAKTLRPGGALVLKAFHGEAFGRLRRGCGERFGSVQECKPAASRSQSRESYLVCRERVAD